jgi:hypothetical protein
MKHFHTTRTRLHHIAQVGLITALLAAASISFAGPCRSGDAAARGGQTGYERDRKGAEQTEQQDRLASDILGRCVSGITSVPTLPTFPSLSDVFDEVKTRICRIASVEISAISSGSSPRASTATSPIAPASPAASSSDFWADVWR